MTHIDEFNKQALEDLRSSRKAQDIEDYLDKYFTEPVGYFWTRLFMHLNWSPNMVTILGMCIGFVGGFLFYPQKWWINLIGILLEIFAYILDATDGQLARLTHTKSELGRILDGLSTGVAYVSIYLSLGCRLMKETIPFTDQIPWGFWIWPIIVFTSLFFHIYQDTMADFYRNLHLLFENSASGAELDHYSEIVKKADEAKENGNLFEYLYLSVYSLWARAQEVTTPNQQILFAAIDAHHGNYPEELRNDFLKESRKIVQTTNLLTFNLRAYTLFILLLLNLHIWYFPFCILVMGSIHFFMIFRYEKIAQNLLDKYYPGFQGGNE